MEHSRQDQTWIPSQVKDKIAQTIALLNQKGLEYEEVLTNQYLGDQRYEFLFPKNPYYRFYISQLFQNGPNSRELQRKVPHQPQKIILEGNLEELTVGCMSEIVKQEMRKGRESYIPFEGERYIQEIEFNQDEQIREKANKLINKYRSIINLKKSEKKKEGEKKEEDAKPSVRSKFQQNRKETGANLDGSLGGFGGKKYEGLGSRDQFEIFRRQQSQNYYSSLNEKKK